MTALYERDHGDGRGQVIDLSLFEPLLGIMGPIPSAYDQLGVVPRRQGNRSRNSAPRNTYLTRDGRWVAVSSGATSVAARVMRLVGRPELAEQPWFSSAVERVRRVDELDGAVQEWIAARDLDEVVAAFDEAGAALFPVYDVAQLVADPQVQARDAVTTVNDEDLGPLRMQNVWFPPAAHAGPHPVHRAPARAGHRCRVGRAARPHPRRSRRCTRRVWCDQ